MYRVVIAALMYLILSSASAYAVETNVSGSTSVARIMDILAEDFNKEHKDINIAVQGVGSSAGITLVKNGVAQIGMSSRYLTESEYTDKLMVEQIAYDGLAVVVSHKNGINNITREQLYKIYTGDIKNWREIGGDDLAIAVVTREVSSGSRYAFEDQVGLTRVLNDSRVSTISPSHLVVNSNSMMKTLISNNQHAVGFISLGSIDSSVKAVSFDGVEPTPENMLRQKYKLSRPFIIFYQKDLNDEDALEFVKYLKSSKAKTLIGIHGYTPFVHE